MEMLVGVDVIERQAGGGIGGKLRLDLEGELPPRRGLAKMSKPSRAMSVRKRPELSTRSGSCSGGSAGRPRPARCEGRS